MAAILKPISKTKTFPQNQAKLAEQPDTLRNLKSVPAAKAKTHLLELLDNVDRKHESVIITKRGRPVARLVPVEDVPPRDIFGYMKGTFRITGDIVSPEPDTWEAMS